MVTKTYLPRRAALLKNFDRAIQRVEKNLVARYGEVEAHSLAMEARREYEILIPRFPISVNTTRCGISSFFQPVATWASTAHSRPTANPLSRWGA